MKRLVALLALLLLTGCATASSVSKGPYKVGNVYQIEVGQQWAALPSTLTSERSGKFLTIDGPDLNLLQLVAALKDKQPLIKERSKDNPVPKYRSDMSQTEIVEFVTDTLATEGYQNIATQALRPSAFGTLSGVRFDLSAQTPDGLNIRGTALFAQRDEKLNLIVYLAPEEYYYGLHAAEIERIFGSVALL
jgi:hypothetical protein